MTRARAVLGVALLGCVALGSPASSATASALPSVTVMLDAPLGQAPDPGAVAAAVSCAAASGCLVVGGYTASSGLRGPMLAASVDGSGPRGGRGPVPAAAGSGANVELRAVSCATFGECVAVGDYATLGGSRFGYSTTWRQGVQANALPSLPANAAADPDEHLNAISCPAGGGCAAVGTYATATNASVPLLQRLALNGHWATPVVLGVPANAAAAPKASLGAASCWATGSCFVAGTYTDASGATRAYVIRLIKYNPGTPAQLQLPGDAAANPHATVASASCPSASWCAISGTYRTTSGRTALFFTSLGAGGTSVAIDLPGDAAANPLATGGAASCVAAAACLVAASYTDTGHDVAGMTALLSGTTSLGTRVVAPAGAGGASESLEAVSCTSLGRCTVAGSALDAQGRTQAVIGAAYLAPGPATSLVVRQLSASSVRLSWTAPQAAGAGASWYSATAADGAGPALPVGQSASSSLVVAGLAVGHRYRFAVTVHADDNQLSAASSPATTTLNVATAPHAVTATARSKAVLLTWQPPATSYGAALSGYVVAVNWPGGSMKLTFGVRRTALVGALVAGRTYTFRIAATTALGTGAYAAPVSATPKP